ncbi:outer membrane protein assembly factor BamC [Marinobacter xestospongiae]|uniref:outer membrane protein assembly factor BamC n=1 Tax=Marinobacter xestospongiae TaxID=994319 RepID=UPI00200570BF|nr:outer membrane protein assembly factor BamC [Marinobacter xestospongiae]MCK7565651.1 outer membrane protein assembly factor BamC [Marinobacter xestospongiae]
MVQPFRTAPRSRGAFAGLAVGCALVAVSGCSAVDDRSLEYVNAPAGEPLKTIDERQRDRIGNAYPIREIDSADSGGMYAGDLPRPPDMTADILEQNYLIEELDDQAWLLINEVPGQVWPGVTAYLNERGFGVAQDSPQLGLVQSELVNFSRRARSLVGLEDGQANEPRILVQARVAPGVRRKTTEVQLRPRVVEGNPDELMSWQPRTDDKTVEKNLLQDLATFLQARADTKSYSRAALGISNEPRVKLVSEDEIPRAIRMDLAFDRAWGEVQRALREAEVAVVDLDRSQGRFYVDYRSSEELDPGMFSWFADEPEPKYTFYVNLEQQGQAIQVTTGRAPDHDGANRATLLLTELFDHLY